MSIICLNVFIDLTSQSTVIVRLRTPQFCWWTATLDWDAI